MGLVAPVTEELQLESGANFLTAAVAGKPPLRDDAISRRLVWRSVFASSVRFASSGVDPLAASFAPAAVKPDDLSQQCRSRRRANSPVVTEEG